MSIKAVFFITFLLCVHTVNISAQDVCVPQSTIDRCARVADELAAARIAIDKFTAEREVSAVAIKSAQTAIDSLQRAIQVGKDIQSVQEQVIETLKGIIKMQGEIIERLEKMLNKPKSAWQKFLATLKTLASIAVGIGIGRGL